MNRTLLTRLREWKAKKNLQPLILKGARQVGKTEFSDTLYVNFEHTPGMNKLFEGSIKPEKIIDLLGAFLGRKIIPEQTRIMHDS